MSLSFPSFVMAEAEQMSVMDKKCLVSLDELHAALETGEPSEVESALEVIHYRMEGVLGIPDDGSLPTLLTELKALIDEAVEAYHIVAEGDSTTEL